MLGECTESELHAQPHIVFPMLFISKFCLIENILVYAIIGENYVLDTGVFVLCDGVSLYCSDWPRTQSVDQLASTSEICVSVFQELELQT